MSSSDNTTISLPTQSITDMAGNVWGLVNGHVLINRTADLSLTNTIQLAYEQGTIWAETSDGSWRSKAGPASPWSGATAAPPIQGWTVSSSGTVISLPGQSIHDASGNTWSIAYNQVALNGVMDGSTSHVLELAYVNGAIWQKNANNQWQGKTSAAAAWSAPTNANPVTGVIPSQDNTVTYDANHSITDASGNVWSLIKSRIYLNGVLDATSSNIALLAYENGQVWQENTSGQWFSKSLPSDAWQPRGAANPVTVTNTKVWIANNPQNSQAFYDPENWGGGFAPKPGDTAIIRDGWPVIDASQGIQNVGADGLTLAVGATDPAQTAQLTIKGNITFAQAMTTETGDMTSIQNQQGTIVVANGSLTNNGQILVQSGAASGSLWIDLQNGAFVNNGVMQETGAHGSLSVGSSGSIVNNGSIGVNGGLVQLDDAITGSGRMSIDGGGLLKIGNAVGAGETIAIDSGTLQFSAVMTTNPGMQFLGTIAFGGIPNALEQIEINSCWAGGAGEYVTLTNIQPGLADLSVFENNAKVLSATLSGHYDATEFSLSHAAANVILTYTPHELTAAVPHS